jgi:predicted GNAT superfamily acetyltransferase
MTEITIRAVTDIDGCYYFQALEQMIWASPELEVVPSHVLITALKNGGMLLGAYAPDGPDDTGGMVGAAFWWLGAGTPTGESEARLKVCSHIVGVLPAWQGQRIGLRLKLAQRQAVLAQGLTDWITWTYDPLYRANGVFNIHRLGATCNTYFRNVYGEMQDALNRGVPSDRCQVDWWLNSEHVLADIEPQRQRPAWNFADFQILPTAAQGELRAPGEVMPRVDGAPIALPIPDDIAAIRARDGALSLAWRLYFRAVLEAAFAAGYTMVDCDTIQNSGWHYILIQEYG